jgi:hypothetical protein
VIVGVKRIKAVATTTAANPSLLDDETNDREDILMMLRSTIRHVLSKIRKKKKKGGNYYYAVAFWRLWNCYVAEVDRAAKDVLAILLYVQFNVLVCDRIWSYSPVVVRATCIFSAW